MSLFQPLEPLFYPADTAVCLVVNSTNKALGIFRAEAGSTIQPSIPSVDPTKQFFTTGSYVEFTVSWVGRPIR